jgi:PAS domain S-box-containing protein
MKIKKAGVLLLVFLIVLSILFWFSGKQHMHAGEAGHESTVRQIDRLIERLDTSGLSSEEQFQLAYQILEQSISSSYTLGKAVAYHRIGVYFTQKRKPMQALEFLYYSYQLFAKEKDTSNILKVSLSLFTTEFYLKDYDNAYSTCRLGLEMAGQKNDPDMSARFLECMANIFHTQGDTAKALDYLKESRKYYLKNGNNAGVLSVYTSIGGIYLDQKRFDAMIRLYDTLVPEAESLDPTSAGIIYTRLAHVYDLKKDLRRSIEFNHKALFIRKKAKLPDMVNSSLINLGGDFLRLNQRDSGLFYINKGLELATANKRYHYQLSAYSYLYDYYQRTGDDEQALQYLKLSSSVNDSILKERLLADISIIKISQNLLKLKENVKILENQKILQQFFIRNQKVFKILLLAITIAVLVAVLLIARIYLRHKRSRRKISDANIKLQHEAAEIKLLQKKTSEKEKHYRFIAEHSLDLIARINKDYLFSYVSPAVSSIFGFQPDEVGAMSVFDLVIGEYSETLKQQLAQIVEGRKPQSVMFLSKRKGNEPLWIEGTFNPVFDPKTGEFSEYVTVMRNIQELKKREMGIVEGTRQKENLLREIHHRVKNNFAILVSLINMQKSQTPSEEVKQSLTNLQLRIRTMALVHEMLYRSEDFENISFPDYVRSVASVISATYGRMNIELDFELEKETISIETAIPLGLILNELLSNSYQHAFGTVEPGRISVTFQKQKETGLYALTVADNGHGLPKDFTMESGSSMGLRIVEILVKQIEARLIIEHSGGTSFSVVFAIES